MLKRELTELGRTVQRRGDIVYHLQEILERDEKRVEDIDRNTIKKTKMLVGGMGLQGRDSCYRNSCWGHRPGASWRRSGRSSTSIRLAV